MLLSGMQIELTHPVPTPPRPPRRLPLHCLVGFIALSLALLAASPAAATVGEGSEFPAASPWDLHAFGLAGVGRAHLPPQAMALSPHHIAPYSKHPAKTGPYAVCPPPTETRMGCMSAIVPTEKGVPVLGPALQGSGKRGGLSPADLRSAYKLPAEGGEANETIAITIAYDDPSAETDLAKYREEYALPPCEEKTGCFKKVNQEGKSEPLPAKDYEWAVETSLDLDMVSAACPKCHILLVEANSNYYTPLFTAVQKAAEMGATVISDSWAGEEYSGEYEEDHYLHHPGVPILFASGDWGYGALYPAASPEVIAVGGTTLKKDASTRGWSEGVWRYAGSGCSSYESKPAWQKDTGCGRHRTVADVSAVADPATAVSIYDSFGFGEGERWLLVGGTSVATPLMAGVEALSTSAFRSTGPEAFYRGPGRGGEFFDPSEGVNVGEYRRGCELGSYLCEGEVGYDGPTGWGTPDGPLFLSKATTEAATIVSSSEATLHGTVNPEGVDTHYQFEYGPTASYGTSVPAPVADLGSGTEDVAVSQTITGLEGGRTYHFRLVAINPGEGKVYGADRTFGTTPPSTSTLIPSVNANDATLRGTVNPWGADTHYRLEFGTTAAYGNSIPFPAEGVGSDVSDLTVSKQLGGLTGEETYHYRVKAMNAAGANYSGDHTLTTPRSQWHVQSTANTNESASMRSVSCTAVTSCLSVGFGATPTSPSTWREEPVSERWNGREWASVSMPATAGGDNGGDNEVNAVSCSSATWCVGVGTDWLEAWHWYPLLARWNGQEWAQVAKPPFEFGSYGLGWGQLDAPGGIARDSKGNIWVADTANNRVEEFSGEGSYIRIAGNSGSGNGELLSPEGVAVDSSGNVWVADASHHRVVEFDPSGEYIRNFGSQGSEPGQFDMPVGIKIDSAGHVWVVDHDGRLEEFTAEGTYMRTIGAWGSGSGQLREPEDLTFDSHNNLWVADHGNNRIAEFSAAGSFIKALGWGVSNGESKFEICTTSCQAGVSGSGDGQFNSPSGLAVDSNDNVWVADTYNNRLQVFGQQGEFIKKFGSAGQGPEKFNLPNGIAFTSDGYAYVLNNGEYKLCEPGTWCVDPERPRVEKWSTANPYPLGIEGNGYLQGVSCTSASWCMAVGRHESSTLAVKWDGQAWTQVATPVPANALFSELEGVSCISSEYCVAVGWYETQSGGRYIEHPLTMVWVGYVWLILPTPEKEGASPWLRGVSCQHSGSSAQCFAVSSNAVLSWNGERWSFLESPPAPVGAEWIDLVSISCDTPSTCTAVGHYSAGWRTVPMAARWNGNTWSLESTSDKSQTQETVGYGSWFRSVSCVDPNICTSVGSWWPATINNHYEVQQVLAESTLRNPAVTTEGATDVTSGSAALHATINPRGLETTYHFEYDTAEYRKGVEGHAAHGTSVPVPDASAGSGEGNVKVSQPVTGLLPGTTYHFRVVASNSEGTSYGEDVTFKTSTATAICNANESACPHPYPSGTKLSASLKPGELVTYRDVSIFGAEEMRCKKSTMEGTLTENPASGEGAKVKGEITSATWGSCAVYEPNDELSEYPVAGCQVVANNLPWSVVIDRTSSGNGTMLLGPHKGGEKPAIKISCEWYPTFTASGKEGESGNSIGLAISGGAPALASANRIEMSTNPVSTGFWTARYNLSPEPLWVTTVGTPPTVLCNATISSCANPYPIGTTLSASLKPGELALYRDVSIFGTEEMGCKESTMEGTLTENPASGEGAKVRGEITSATWGSCALYETLEPPQTSANCSVVAKNLPWSVTIDRTSHGDGTMLLGPHAGGEKPAIKISCEWYPTFTASGKEGESGNSIGLAISGGSPAFASANSSAMSTNYSTTGFLWAPYKLSPEPLWVEAYFLG